MLSLSNAIPQQIIIANRYGHEVGIVQPQQEERKRKARKLPKALSQSMIDRLFGEIKMHHQVGLRNRAIFETMLRAGLRAAETCDLTPANVDLEEGLIHVINGKGGVDRNVPIRPALAEWLRKWAAERPQNAPYYFCTAKGTRIAPRYLNTVLHGLSKDSGVYLQDGLNKIPVSCHKLRHTCATSWLKEKLSLPEIQRLLGHKDINTTMIYLSVSMDEIKQKFDAMDREGYSRLRL